MIVAYPSVDCPIEVDQQGVALSSFITLRVESPFLLHLSWPLSMGTGTMYLPT